MQNRRLNASRVIRAWGTWRNAADVFAGARPPRRAEREAVTLVRGFRRSDRRPPLDGLLEWLAGEPATMGMHAYDQWARDRNAQLSPEDQRYLGGSGVAAAMEMDFAPARRQAEAILIGEEPPLPENSTPADGYDVDGRKLVTLAGFAAKFGLTKQELLGRVGRAPLPPPVVRHHGRVFWLSDDCESWGRGETIERRDGELNETILDQSRLAERLGLKLDTAHSRYLHSPHLLPAPGGDLGGRPWWSATAVERWRAEHTGQRRLHYRYRGSSIIEVRGQRLLTLPAVCELLGVSEQTFIRMRRRRPLVPAVVGIFGPNKLWLCEDVEAYRDGHVVERTQGELNSFLLSIPSVAERLGVTPSAVRRGVVRRSDHYPQPDGAIGTKPWWDAESFERWLADRQEDGQRDA